MVRWLNVTDYLLSPLIRKTPRPLLHACLRVGGFELIEAAREQRPERIPKVIDHAVTQVKQALSVGESRMTNAVLRQIPERIEHLFSGENAAMKCALPEWLYARWVAQFGDERAAALGEWLLEPPKNYIRWFADEPPPNGFEETQWPGFYSAGGAAWAQALEALQQGRAYVQDPSTRVPEELLDVQPGETVLDLCAAPGGKTIGLLKALGDNADGLLVAVDLPGERIERLDENLKRFDNDSGPEVQLLMADVRDLSVEQTGQFAAVMLDAPCSNTGVIRRRPDVKWRLTPEDIGRCADLQLALLRKAAELVFAGGRLVYSTCSIEEAENAEVVRQFLAEHSEFELLEQRLGYTTETGHDGGGAFLLMRRIG